MSRTLTEKQEKFLAVLFEEARGIPARATELAGMLLEQHQLQL